MIKKEEEIKNLEKSFSQTKEESTFIKMSLTEFKAKIFTKNNKMHVIRRFISELKRKIKL